MISSLCKKQFLDSKGIITHGINPFYHKKRCISFHNQKRGSTCIEF